MKKVFITIIETEYGEIDNKKIEEIKKIIRDGNTFVEFYELDKVKLIHLED